jgi:PAS domain S-box-containing protein
MASRSTAELHSNLSQFADDRLFHYLVDSVQDYAIFFLDLGGHVASWNPGAQRLKQYTSTEIIGKHFSIFYPAADRDRKKPEMELAVATSTGRFEDEGWRLRKDGSRFWANVIITRINDEHGNHLGFGKITRDLTERRQAEQHYRLLVESVEDYAIYSLDPTGKITSWNSGVERIKGYKADEVIGKHFSIFYTPADASAGVPLRALEIAAREGHYESEGWRVRKDGSKFWSSVVLSAIHDEEGNLVGFSKVTRDITDRKQLIDQLSQHARDLEIQVAERERANAELEAFSYSVSHDLRAPLRAIGGFSEALKEDCIQKLDEAGVSYVNEIIAASARMNRLVEDLLEYGRLGRAELLPHSIKLLDAVNQALQQLDEPHGKRVTVEIGTSESVLANGATLVQVISNLISNALKFHIKNVEPEVNLRSVVQPNGWLRLSVSDQGIGIARHHQERIFHVFERLHDREAYPGTGIGLAIVKRGVERMGGRYGVESDLDKGSTFWIELPTHESKDDLDRKNSSLDRR